MSQTRIKIIDKRVSRKRLDDAVMSLFHEYDSRGAGLEGLAASLMFAEAVSRRLFGPREEIGPYSDLLRVTISRLRALKAQIAIDIQEQEKKAARRIVLPGE
jgi:hypothetical protein